jgi:HAE1 family hydrophobic/amphiphilic exporter-1
VFDGVERAYVFGLRGFLRFPGVVGFVLLALFCGVVGLYPFIGTELMPKTDEGSLRIDTQMASGIQLKELAAKAAVLDEAVKNTPEANTWVSLIGDGSSEADDWNEARMRIRLIPKSERTRKVTEITKQLKQDIGSLPGMKITVQASTEMRIFRMMSYRSGTQSDIEVEVRGHDLATGEQLARAVGDLMKGIPGLSNIQLQLEDKRPELVTTVDRSKASMMGINVGQISQALETNVRGTEATVYREAGDEFNIRVWLREADRHRLSDVEYVGVPTGSGQVVALKNLVKFDQADVPVNIERRDQQRFLGITADVVDRDLGSTVQDLREQLRTLELPEGFSLNIAGDWEQQQESFNSLKLGFFMAILLMYMVMAAQFESLLHPLLILVSVPLGAIGVILILVFTETTLNVQSYIGIVMLAGIVVNNAIVLIDYANQLRESEPETQLRDVIIKASRRRFRPILMTTLTTVLAMLPLGLGWGEGSELQAPMARVVIGGLISGTLITLVAIPLLYQAVEGRRQKPTPAATA